MERLPGYASWDLLQAVLSAMEEDEHEITWLEEARLKLDALIERVGKKDAA